MYSLTVNTLRIKIFILLLAHLSIALPVWAATQNPTDKESFERAYTEGRALFYRTLKQKALLAQLEEEDRETLVGAEKKISGLYEHLINFYYYVEWEELDKNNFHNSYLSVVTKMADEFVTSIPIRRWSEKSSPLRSVLKSTGFFAKKFVPKFRKFLRPTTLRIKSQWALKELRVRKAHSYAKGEGVRLAIIDSGVDPTIKEIKSQIATCKNFLDGSNPLEDSGRFPFDWGGHGTSVATIINQFAPKTEMIIVKVFDQETMLDAPLTKWSMYLIAAGIIWAAQNGADIINLSVSLRKEYPEILKASIYCWQQNISVVAAVGNAMEEKFESIPYYPASYPWTIAVGGVEKEKGKLIVWQHSAKGDYIDVVAPADNVWVESPSYLDKRQWPKQVAGNSLAVPVVAGTTALVLSALEQERIQTLNEKPGFLVEAIRLILRRASSNKKLGFEAPNPASGFGLLDTCRAVRLAMGLKIEE